MDEFDWAAWDAATEEYMNTGGEEIPDWMNTANSGEPPATWSEESQQFTQTFDDGSTLITDKDGNVIGSTPATDQINDTGDKVLDSAGAGTGGTSGGTSGGASGGTSGGTAGGTAPKSAAQQMMDKLKGVVSTNGAIDYTKLAPMLAGLYAATKSNKTTQPAGYQGTIPKYTATRQAPGPGQKISGNVLYTKAVPPAAAPAAGLAAANTPVVEQPMAKGGALQSGGFVIPADVVSHLGNGSSEAGLRVLAQRFGAQPIKGKGDGMSDSIKTTIDGRQPARVANEEAHLTKEQVRAAGGAQKLYDMMAKIRKARTGNPNQGKQIDPGKFMPGGSVQRYTTGGTTSVPAGTTGTESSLSNWAGDYVTDMLGKGQALSEMPYEQYQGPLTAGPSALQQQVFTGLQNTAFPNNLGQTFTGATAQQYMNPYLSAVLNPQLEEQRRQAQINNLQGLGSFTKSGAFGGGRQAIMESENARNLMQEQNKTIGQAYANAYDKGMQQFNTEQGQARTLVDLLAQQGATQRGIESDAVAADKAQFEEARLNPYKMVQFQQSLLSGLPLAAQTFNQAPTDNLTQFANAATTVDKLLATLGQKPATTAASQ